MAVPTAVLEQEREAEEIFQEVYGKKDPEGGTPPEEGTPPEKAEETPDPEKAIETPPEKVEEVAPTPKETSVVDSEEYRRLSAAHEVLKGKYNAEGMRQREEIALLRAELETIKKSLAAPKPEPVKVDDDTVKIYADIEKDMGKEFAENVKRAARAEAKKLIEENNLSVKGEIEGVSKAVAKTREERFLADLSALNKNWRTSYSDPQFVEMLGEEEPLTGKTYGQLATDANEAMDARRLANIYNLFDQRKAAVAAPAPKPPVPAAPGKEGLIVPDASSKSTVDTGSEKPDYMQANDIQRFYQDLSLGRYRDKPKEAADMEARINRAVTNRWVIGG